MKHRIREDDGKFYPEYKGWFFWKAFYKIGGNKVKVSFGKERDALQFLQHMEKL